jgi:hypothetical protein
MSQGRMIATHQVGINTALTTCGYFQSIAGLDNVRQKDNQVGPG